MTLLDADARARTCSFAYATSSFVQASVQHARGDAFFAALAACDDPTRPNALLRACCALAIVPWALRAKKKKPTKSKPKGWKAKHAARQLKRKASSEVDPDQEELVLDRAVDPTPKKRGGRGPGKEKPAVKMGKCNVKGCKCTREDFNASAFCQS